MAPRNGWLPIIFGALMIAGIVLFAEDTSCHGSHAFPWLNCAQP